MAGDWIKMRGNLWDDPRVARLCDLTEQTEAAIVGGLYWLWATADQHTEDGLMPGLTLRQIDRKTGIQGFGAALVEIGWLSESESGVTLANFEEHNGSSAKRRCMDAQRKANGRNLSASDADKVEKSAGSDEDETRRSAELEKEKRREEKKEKKTGAGAPRPARNCPSDFFPSEELRDQMRSELPAVDLDAETAKFKDHTFPRAITDWPGAWRNWIRNSVKYAPRPPPTDRGRSRAELVDVWTGANKVRDTNIIDMEPTDAALRIVG